MQLPPYLQDMLRRASRTLRSSAAVTHWLFHAKVTNRVHHDLWDATSIVLRMAIRQYVRDGHRVLDLGTGHIGVLAVYCAAIRQARVTAVDINERFLENAANVAAASGVHHIRFLRSDWFSEITGQYDVILSNIPYVPTSQGETRKDATEFREVWDGGEDGLMHARTILSQAAGFLTETGRVLLGLNAAYVPRRATVALIEAAPGLELEDIVVSRWSPGEVYVVRPSR
jgi:methylase of polypeptide subunit release factors